MSYVNNKISNNSILKKYEVNKTNSNSTNKSFGEIYDNLRKSVVEDIKISKHAQSRILTRNILIDDIQMNKISNAMMHAENKGIKNAMIMFDSNIAIANIKNKTIITLVNKNDLDENIITNIDGAIFI